MHVYLKHLFEVVSDWAPYIVSGLVNAVLVFLGVIMSLPNFAESIEKRYKKVFAGGCIALGSFGLFANVVERHNSDKQTRQLVRNVDDMVQKTAKLVDDTNQMMSTLGWLAPQITTINTHLSNIDTKIAENRNNPTAIAVLEAQRKQELSKLVEMTPGIISALVARARYCYDKDNLLQANEGMGNDQQKKDSIRKWRKDLDQMCMLLTGPAWSGHRFIELGSMVSADEVAEQLGEVLKRDVKAFAVPRAGWAEAFEQFGVPKGHTGPAEEMFEGVNTGWMDLGITGTEHVAGTTSARDVFAAAQQTVKAKGHSV
jgi:hypothetical protein